MQMQFRFQLLLLGWFHRASAVDPFKFQHADCFDVYGDMTGLPVNKPATQYTAQIEGYAFFGASEMRTSGIDIKYDDKITNADDEYPIPTECFKHKGPNPEMLFKDQDQTLFDFAVCKDKSDRTPQDMLRICFSVCRKVSGCIGVVYESVYGSCKLHSDALDFPKCGYYPYRFGCAARKTDRYLAVQCPEKPLDAHFYGTKVKTPPLTPVPPTTYVIGGKLELGFATARSCADDALKTAVLATLKEVLGTEGGDVWCPDEQGSDTKLVYMIRVQPALDVHALWARIDDNTCCTDGRGDFCGVAKCAAGGMWVDTFAPRLATELGLAASAAPTVFAASVSTWSMKSLTSKAGLSEHHATVHEYPHCVDADGNFAGFKIAEDFAVRIIDMIETVPEEHGPITPFFLSMRNPNDWFPIPVGCFNDFNVGTASNPAMAMGAKHYELLDKFIDGKPYDCLGNRTEEEMVRICVTICRQLTFAAGPDETEQFCIGINYDEHGGSKGHCHLSSPLENRVIAHDSPGCKGLGQGQDANPDGWCVVEPPMKPHGICDELGLSVGMKPSCGMKK